MKLVNAVAPYIHPEYLNFKTAPYEAWVKCGGKTAKPHYPARLFHKLAFQHELPTLWKNKKEARLRFVEPVSITFDSFPDYTLYEIIPFIWDCWPKYFEKMSNWLQKHNVKTAIFTSSQTADRMRQRFPEMNIMYCPEAVDTSIYAEGNLLTERKIDLLEFGRSNEKVIRAQLPETVNHVCTKKDGKFIYSNKELYAALGDAKITIALPRSYTQPWIAGDIETLTQRFWENMLSRIVMVGHAPKELTGLIGYNPVVELEEENANEQLVNILNHICDYQELVNRNRETALRLGDWTLRMREVMSWLLKCGYKI